MTMPLVILAVCAVLLGFVGMPFMPWFQTFLTGEQHGEFEFGPFLALALTSTAVVAVGVMYGWRLYGNSNAKTDPIQERAPGVYAVLQNKFYFDELYRDTAIAFYKFAGHACAVFEKALWAGTVQVSSVVLMTVAWFNRGIDEFAVNGGFDRVTSLVRNAGNRATKLQAGQIQGYLRILSLGLALLVLLFAWGCHSK